MASQGPCHYELGYRTLHTSDVVGENLFTWGGYQDGLPNVHIDDRKVPIIAAVNVLNLSSFEWSRLQTSGVPPKGAKEYKTAVVGTDIIAFGGKCDSLGKCCHNDLYVFNTINSEWKTVQCFGSKPVKKCGCGFISYTYEGHDYLLAMGGVGERGVARDTDPSDAQYISCHSGSYFMNNEVHIMNLTGMGSTGEWEMPSIEGEAPPPLSHFTLNALPSSSPAAAVLFGGSTCTMEEDKLQCNSELYFLLLDDHSVHFTKLLPQRSLLWPSPRSRHSSTVITTSNNGCHLLVMGGYNDENVMAADSWVFNIATRTWHRIDLPNEICERRDHSVSSIAMSANIQWLVVTGGRRSGFSLFKGADVTVVAEIEYVGGLWVFRQKWNSSSMKGALVQRMTELEPQVQRPSYAAEIEQLRQQMANEQEQLMQTIADLQIQVREKNAIIERKDSIINRKDIELQQNTELITQQRQEIDNYRHNPHWLIQQNEISLTEQEVGTGAYARVVVGSFRGTKVAVKVFHELIDSPHNRDLFMREISIASRISHPNLIQFIGAVLVQEGVRAFPMLVLELMGTTLQMKIKEKKQLAKPHVVSISKDVLSGLNYLHQWKPHPILHRDVSSSNVLLEENTWKAKLCDYGSANYVDQIRSSNPGNPFFSAPEADNYTQHSPGMDIYSFGVVLLHMISGQILESSEDLRVVIRVMSALAIQETMSGHVLLPEHLLFTIHAAIHASGRVLSLPGTLDDVIQALTSWNFAKDVVIQCITDGDRPSASQLLENFNNGCVL